MLLVAAVVAFAQVAFHSLRVGQVQEAFRFGVEEGEGLDRVGNLEVVVHNPLDLDPDPDHNPSAGHLGEVDRRGPRAHILQEEDLDQVGNVSGAHSLQVGAVGLGLTVNWEGEVGVVASEPGEQDWDLDLDLGDPEEVRWQDLGPAGRLAHDY